MALLKPAAARYLYQENGQSEQREESDNDNPDKDDLEALYPIRRKRKSEWEPEEPQHDDGKKTLDEATVFSFMI